MGPKIGPIVKKLCQFGGVNRDFKGGPLENDSFSKKVKSGFPRSGAESQVHGLETQKLENVW